MGATLHDLPPELIHHILSHLSPSKSSAPTTSPLNRGTTPPAAFDQIAIYGPFARASRHLYEISEPFLYSSLTINAIINNVGMDHWHAEPLAYHGIRDDGLQRQIRSLKELVTAWDGPERALEEGVSKKTRNSMCSYIKNVTLVFVNQQTTRPGLFRAAHCQACAMSPEEIKAAKILAKADFEGYIEAMPAARAALGDLVSILERLDGVESFQALKRNREIEPEWGCDPVELGGWILDVGDGCVDGGEEKASVGMVRIPSFVWANKLNLQHVKVKGLVGNTDVEGKQRCWGELKRLLEFADGSAYIVAPGADTAITLEVVEDAPGGMLAMVNGGHGSLEWVKVARFDVHYPGKGRHQAIENWLYKFLALSRDSLTQLELAIEELPKMRSPDPAPLEGIPELPLLRRIHISFRTDLRRPRVWKRLATLLQPILHSASNVSELSLEMIEPGQPSWDAAHCGKTLSLMEQLGECMGDMIAQHAGVGEVTVRVEHNCSSTDRCKRRVAQGDWFQRARESGKEVVIHLESRA